MFLSIASFLGNTLILVALSKESSLHPSSKLLLRSLAATDLCVGIINQPLYVTHRFSVVYDLSLDYCRINNDRQNVAYGFFTDISCYKCGQTSRLQLLLGLRYKKVVTLKRTYVTVFTFWVSSFVGSIILLRNDSLSSWYSRTVELLCVVVSIYSYTRIFLWLRHHQTQVQDNVTGQPNHTTPLNIARYRKTASSALWLQLSLVVCYLPFIVAAPLAFREIPRSLFSAFYLPQQFTVTLVYFNSSLNPIFYCWKIRDVRQAVKEIVRLFVCSSSW